MKIATSCPCCSGTRIDRSPAVLAPFVAERVFGWVPAVVTAEWGLRDIPEGHAASICNGCLCLDCTFLFLDMRFDDEEMAALYADYRGPAYRAARERYEPGYGRRNDLLHEQTDHLRETEAFLAGHLPARPAVLDWGGDTGLNTPFCGRARTHHVYDISGKGGLFPGAESVDEAASLRESYDLVVSAQVLEHVPAPLDLLLAMKARMAPHTILYVETPHENLVRLVDEPRVRLSGKRHWHEHINFFTEPALDALLARAGLEPIERISIRTLDGGADRHVFMLTARLPGGI